MKGDIAFVGFMLTADEWQALDAQSRAQLIAVATRRADPWFDERRRRLADGTGPHEIVEVLDEELEELDELAELVEDDAAAQLSTGGAAELPAADRLFDASDIPDEISFADLDE